MVICVASTQSVPDNRNVVSTAAKMTVWRQATSQFQHLQVKKSAQRRGKEMAVFVTGGETCAVRMRIVLTMQFAVLTAVRRIVCHPQVRTSSHVHFLHSSYK